MKSLLIGLASVASLSLTACVTTPATPGDPYFAPIEPQQLTQVRPVTGSIYDAAVSRDIYSDGRATRVGDILTVVLSESTQSSKSNTTTVDKTSSLSVAQPTIMGEGVTLNGQPLSATLNGPTTAFEGAGASNMNNSLTGNITVTVHRVLPNGSLVVRGEKWLTLNQGQEYIRVTGRVRPQDITQANTIESTKLADARLEYSGTGELNDSNMMGWASKFFISPLWPF
ncbi:MAG: flagellar basal body L-ring protein FlgH [Pontibacterium sp.]